MERSLEGAGWLGPRLTMLAWACHSHSGPQLPQMRLLFLVSALCSIIPEPWPTCGEGVACQARGTPAPAETKSPGLGLGLLLIYMGVGLSGGPSV